jgi:transcriptional regulator with XRE-family HTH domain
MTAIKSTSSGDLLKYWRQVRNVSQMDLALECDTSSRHLSCVETGRAHPSRQLLLRLCNALKIPLRVRNTILISSGYAHIYQDTGLSEPEMQEARLILNKILRLNDPYPAMLIDRCWNIIMCNSSFEVLCQAFIKDATLLQVENLNLLRLIFHPDAMASYIENLPYVYETMMERARRSLIVGDPNNQLADILDEMLQYRPKPQDGMSAMAVNDNQIIDARQPEVSIMPQLIMPLHFRKDSLGIKFFTTVTTLGSPLNIALQELQIESAYPLDDDSERIFMSFMNSQKTLEIKSA